MKGVKDIAMWEETDSELAKYKIQALNGLVNSYKRQNEYLEANNEYLEASIEHIEQVNKKLYERIDKAIKEIDYFELKATHLDDAIYLDKELSNRLLDILRGEDNE